MPVSSQAAMLAPTPYMGWNTYYGVGGHFDETTIKSVANTLISSRLAPAGYRIVWLDFGWATGARDSSGQLIVDSTQWPDRMTGLTAWLHQHGLQAGIYTDAGSSGCNGQGVGSYGHYQQDANTFAAWGFDAVKLDFCGAGQEGFTPQPLSKEFSRDLSANSSGRPMILNVCNFWTPGKINGTDPTLASSSWDNYQWAPALSQSWRTDTDIGFTGDIQFQWVLRNLDQDATHPEAAGPPSSTIPWGHWNDPDYLGPQLGMTSTQSQSQLSMWAMLTAPLILGSDPRTLSSATISMLANANVIAIDQDSLGAQGTLLSQTDTRQQVWVKPLADGARAVALFNRGSSAQQITTTATAVGLPKASHYTLLNVWTNQTSTTNNNISGLVQPDAVILYRVTVGQGSQTITFTSSAPTAAVVGGPVYTVAARGGGSDNPVTFSSATPRACSVSGSTVSFVGVGTCTIRANQAGNADYAPAPAATQTFAVAASKKKHELCVVPRLKGKRLKAAKRALRNAHCAVGKITKRKSSTVSKGRVISSRPKAGSTRNPGTKVSLTVSRGKH